MSNDSAKFRAIVELENLMVPLITKKRYDVLLELREQGVDLVHALSSAVYGRRFEQAQWLLDQGVRPNERTLVLAIDKGKHMTALVLPFMKSFSETHLTAALDNGQFGLAESLLNLGVLPEISAFRTVGSNVARQRSQKTKAAALLVSKGQPWRHGTRALIHILPVLTAQQVIAAIGAAPLRFNREKLVAHAIRNGQDAVAIELLHFGFGTKITPRVALLAVGGKQSHFQDDGLCQVTQRLADLHEATRSPPLPQKVIGKLLRKAVRSYICSFNDDVGNRGERYQSLLLSVMKALSLGEERDRVSTLKEYQIQFLIDRVDSPQARHISDIQKIWPRRFADLLNFRGEFEKDLQQMVDQAEAIACSESEAPFIGGP